MFSCSLDDVMIDNTSSEYIQTRRLNSQPINTAFCATKGIKTTNRGSSPAYKSRRSLGADPDPGLLPRLYNGVTTRGLVLPIPTCRYRKAALGRKYSFDLIKCYLFFLALDQPFVFVLYHVLSIITCSKEKMTKYFNPEGSL